MVFLKMFTLLKIFPIFLLTAAFPKFYSFSNIINIMLNYIFGI